MTQIPKPTAAKAQDQVMPALSLFDESADADRALLHLDEAIFCLKRLLAQGRAGMSETHKRRSA